MRLVCLLLTCIVLAASATGQEKAGSSFTIGEGRLSLTAPANWTKKEPASRIVEIEFAVPPAKGDETPGRLTGMGAGGSVESNVDRWVDQFTVAGGPAVKPKRDK